MKNPLSPFDTFVVSVTFFLVASHLLLKYADGARFWLQQELARGGRVHVFPWLFFIHSKMVPQGLSFRLK
ncbi:hypothetical protein PSI9734_01376 [Pseudidiomarina piscicola]|uniref:Uncharacterized protein n=1 Tax=Pseudidiomarina piscicola TaxID=2614830 RepID=A0A6S6WMF0_9GAMM|nr:hypothetical protein PSI9734_01376 [Pseudidiomarina piscicola]VZT40443.1 hypothetical protein PSI9734_01376 [Pseudomonas aeruginosa]